MSHYLFFFFLIFCCKIIILQDFSSTSRLCFTSSIPPQAAEPSGSFCAGFVSMRGQENAARATEAPRRTSQEFSSWFSFPPPLLGCFHLATKNTENSFNVTFSSFPLSPSGCFPERSDVEKTKSWNMMSPLN